MNLDDLFDGVFTYLRADELRRWDVLFDPVCLILDDPCALSARVSLDSELEQCSRLVDQLREARAGLPSRLIL